MLEKVFPVVTIVHAKTVQGILLQLARIVAGICISAKRHKYLKSPTINFLT